MTAQCQTCGRVLAHPISIARGWGPICDPDPHARHPQRPARPHRARLRDTGPTLLDLMDTLRPADDPIGNGALNDD
jgi:hypothetical protein